MVTGDETNGPVKVPLEINSLALSRSKPLEPNCCVWFQVHPLKKGRSDAWVPEYIFILPPGVLSSVE